MAMVIIEVDGDDGGLMLMLIDDSDADGDDGCDGDDG